MKWNVGHELKLISLCYLANMDRFVRQSLRSDFCHFYTALLPTRLFVSTFEQGV